MIHRTNRWVIVIVIFLLLVSIIEATDVNMVRESAAESIRKYTETADKALAAASNLDNRIEKEYEAKEYGTAIKLLEEKIFAYQTTERS